MATRFIIAKLRNRRFFSLAELNVAIAELVAQLNNRMSRHLGASRRALFEELERAAATVSDRPALQPWIQMRMVLSGPNPPTGPRRAD